MTILHYYRRTETPHSLVPSINEQLHHLHAQRAVVHIDTEYCFNVHTTKDLDSDATYRLEWLLRETFDPTGLQLECSTFTTTNSEDDSDLIVEFGPRSTFTSAFSSNATSICAACGLSSIVRLERSRRYRITFSPPSSPSSSDDEDIIKLKSLLHDRMTEQEYITPITTFHNGVTAVSPVKTIPIMEEGKSALMKLNTERGLGFDDFDINFYTDLFKVCMCIFILILLFCTRRRAYKKEEGGWMDQWIF
jgi:phosphoribosylformylglycinamidine synthase